MREEEEEGEGTNKSVRVEKEVPRKKGPGRSGQEEEETRKRSGKMRPGRSDKEVKAGKSCLGRDDKRRKKSTGLVVMTV